LSLKAKAYRQGFFAKNVRDNDSGFTYLGCWTPVGLVLFLLQYPRGITPVLFGHLEQFCKQFHDTFYQWKFLLNDEESKFAK